MKRHPSVSAAEIGQQWKHLSWSWRTGIFHVIVDRLFEYDPWIVLGLLFYLTIAGFQESECRWCPTYSLPNPTTRRSVSRILFQTKKWYLNFATSVMSLGESPPQIGAEFFFGIEAIHKYLLFFRKFWLVGESIRAGYAEGRWRARNSELSLCSHKVKVTSWLSCWPPICRRATRINWLMSRKSCSTLSR